MLILDIGYHSRHCNPLRNPIKRMYFFPQVAVALMVGILFMLNIGAELCFDAIVEKVCDMFGSKGEPDIENQDPAALVGTFKRYK